MSMEAYVLSSIEVELGGSKDWPVWNIIMYWNGRFTLGVNAAKITNHTRSLPEWENENVGPLQDLFFTNYTSYYEWPINSYQLF